MPKGSKKKKVENTQEESDSEEMEEDEEESQKTSIQISTKVRNRLWRLKFRKTYDEFLNDLCDLYENQSEMD